MLTESNSVEAKQFQQGQQQSSNFIETLQDKLKDIKNFSHFSAKEQVLVASAVGAIFGAALPVLAVALPAAATAVIVALTIFFAVKAVEYAFKGLKWSAEKTVEGTKYTAGKIKKGVIHARDSLREAVSSVAQATREGTSATLKTVGNKLGNLGASMSSLDSIPYSIESHGQTVVLKTEEKTKNFNNVKEMFIKEVFKGKDMNNSGLIREIFSKLGEKILEKAYSVDGQQAFKKHQLISQLEQQANFINKLSAKKLENLLAQDDNNLYEIFSEHHDEIKRIIGECKTEYQLSSVIERLNESARKHGESKRHSAIASLSKSDSVITVSSTAGLLNPEEHKQTTPLTQKVSSLFGGKKVLEEAREATNVKYQALGTIPAATIGGRPGIARRNSTGNLTKALTPKVPTISANLDKVVNSSSQSSLSEAVFNDPTVKQNLDGFSSGTLTRSNSVSSVASNSSYLSTLSGRDDSIASKSSSFSYRGGSDSGRGVSATSTPEKIIISSNDLSKARSQLRKVNSQKKIVEQQLPSTYISGQKSIEVRQTFKMI